MLFDYFLFLAKTATFVVAILLITAGIVAIVHKGKDKTKGKLEIKNLNEKYHEMQEALNEEILDKHQQKQLHKTEKKQKKATKSSTEEQNKQRIFVLNFHGDIRASGVKMLREEITALLTVVTPKDEIVVCLESPGGMVHSYGLAASQLKRIRSSKIPLTVIVDKVAASGGYMMASVGNKILAAPFAIIGSIGVIAQIPNFHRLLKKNDIEFEQIMAGEYKRTLTLFGENTEQGREKFQQEVNETQELFKAFLKENRPELNIDQVATGEHWYGAKAIELKLIDELMTSDDYLLHASHHADIFEVCYTPKKTMTDKLLSVSQKGYDGLLRIFSNNQKS